MYDYNHLNEFYKKKFNERVLKIPIDGGFTCPNRDGKCGVGGCIFCGDSGSGNKRESLGIKSQIMNHLLSYKGSRANKFIAYFQSFTNTYETIDILKMKYDEALNSSEKIVGLSIATRPDAISEEIVKLIASYKEKAYVQVELGLQSSSDKTSQIINRGYESKIFIDALKLLNKYDIDVVVHIMVGLPYETKEDLKNTILFLNKQKFKGIKIHSTYVLKGTKLEELYLNGKYIPLRIEDYIESVIYIITHISKDVIVHRITGDAPKESLVAPIWNVHKKIILNSVLKEMRENKLYQGIYYK